MYASLQYYMGSDMYMFDTFHTAIDQPPRRPKASNHMDGWMDGWMDRNMDGWVNGWEDR